MRDIIVTLVLIALTGLQGTNAIKCKLCIGSTTSDCANDVEDSMVIQDCQPIKLPPGSHHHRRHHFPHNHFETTSIRNLVDNTIHEEATTTSYPENHGQNVDEQINDDESESRFSHRKLDISCVYIRVNPSNITSSLVTRGCGYAPHNKNLCDIVKKLNDKVVDCQTCVTDECN